MIAEKEFTTHILRNWSRERIVAFCNHLLGDAAQEASEVKNKTTSKQNVQCKHEWYPRHMSNEMYCIKCDANFIRS